MSIVWLEPFIFDPTSSNIFTFQSLNIVIYLNMISIICFVVYSMMYKMDSNMRKPPNTLIIWKMFGECLNSFHFLVLFLCFSLENNKRKLEKTNTIMILISIISPVSLFITYFFNACIAQNLYTTFYTYKNDFDKRMKVYKVIALVGGIVVLIVSIIFNNQSNLHSVTFSFKFYPSFYIALFYIIGGVALVFIIFKMIYVVNRRDAFFSFLNQSQGVEEEFRKNLISLFLKRHLSFCLLFVICYLPNNLILLIQIFSSMKICSDCRAYAFSVYLMSLSCTFSFVIKMSEPYMKKYIKTLAKFLYKDIKDDDQQLNTDYSKLYQTDNNLVEEIPLETIEEKEKKTKRLESTMNLQKMADTIGIVTREMQSSDFYTRMFGIVLSLYEDEAYDKDPNFTRKAKSYLPWEDDSYTSKSPIAPYNKLSLLQRNLKLDESMDIKNINVSVRKYAPLVFHHLRKIDDVQIDQLIESLDPNKNLKIIKENFASGGRSVNPILFTHDKKFLLKTISKSEKNILLKMLPEFHRRMKDCKSFLCRIYSVFRIKIADKEDVHLILMRNMNELSTESRIAVFDLKGSTVDRSVLDSRDKKMIENGRVNEVLDKYRKKILKDNDFSSLGFDIRLSRHDAHMLQQNLSSDAEFLKGYNLTDYSCLLSLHEYNKEAHDKAIATNNYRILPSSDGRYLYNFSIIDYLTEYGMMKLAEKKGKEIGIYVARKGDANISVQDALTYSRRFIRFITSRFADDLV